MRLDRLHPLELAQRQHHQGVGMYGHLQEDAFAGPASPEPNPPMGPKTGSPKSVHDIIGVIRLIDCEPFEFSLGTQDASAGHYYLQVQGHSPCSTTGRPHTWRGAKWNISKWMTDGEIVQTALKAVLAAVEHEAREAFKYRGLSIFDPHYDIEKLVELRSRGDALKEREPHGSR